MVVDNINPYLIDAPNTFVQPRSKGNDQVSTMYFGNKPVDGGHLSLTRVELVSLGLSKGEEHQFIRRLLGSAEFIQGKERYCIWIENEDLTKALSVPSLRARIEEVRRARNASRDPGARDTANRAHQFREMRQGRTHTIGVAAISSENREYIPCGLLNAITVTNNKMYALFDAPLWNMALIASRLHWVWIGTVCVRMRTDFSYSNTLGWNTFPVPALTEQNKADLTRCAEDILLAREAHFPATIADLYDPETMPANLRAAHEANDETLERIYIGRRFKNDTERLEKLFEMYAAMTEKKISFGNDKGKGMTARKAKAKTEADSSAALRNDKQGLLRDDKGREVRA